jgi:predicted MFS family arabinose efflux permease
MPTRIRATGMSIAMIINQGVSATIATIFPAWKDAWGFPAVFYCLAGFTVVYFITAAFFLPETKGRTLEEIEQYFKTGKMDR